MTKQLSQPLQQQRAYSATSELAQFATTVASQLNASEPGWLYSTQTPSALQSQREDRQSIHLDLTPFQGRSHPADAARWFAHVENLEQLLAAYQNAKSACFTEPDDHVHRYAQSYLKSRFDDARANYSDADARLIARWVSELDGYAAVKSVECLLDCRDNLVLFNIAADNDWRVLFDHLAIRCGSSKYQHAEQVIAGLQQQHGYVQSQLEHERFYQFDDGWNAYPLYKMLDNGQVIRLFIDQSDADDSQQIIQHWNYCYGFTAHHLALRVVRRNNNHYQAVPLREVIDALTAAGLQALTATGFYTHGLLEQVFLKPHQNPEVPAGIRQKLSAIDPALNNSIENGKLIELVSRRELAVELTQKFLHLYGIKNQQQPLSTPIYPYFLPAQAAHVIRTSLHTSAQGVKQC